MMQDSSNHDDYFVKNFACKNKLYFDDGISANNYSSILLQIYKAKIFESSRFFVIAIASDM